MTSLNISTEPGNFVLNISNIMLKYQFLTKGSALLEEGVVILGPELQILLYSV